MVAAIAAVLTGIAAATPPSEQTVSVVRAVHQLDAGQTVASRDVESVRLPVDAVPQDAFTDPDAVVGQTLISPVPVGQLITPLDLPSTPQPRAGHTLVPVRLADPGVIALLQVGQIVDVHASNPDTGRSTLVAAGVQIVAIPALSQDSADERAVEGLLLIDARTSEVPTLLSSNGIAPLSFVWR